MSLAATPHQQLTSEVDRLESRLRRQLMSWLSVRGLARLVWLVLAIVAVDFLLDWSFELDFYQRLIVLVGVVGGVGFAVYRWLVQPLSVELSSDAFVLEVERRNTFLEESLISSVQFARASGNGNSSAAASRSLMDAAIAQGYGKLKDVDLSHIFDVGSWRRHLSALILGVMAVVLLGAGVASANLLNVWFQRNVLLADAAWPRDTILIVENANDGVLRVARGGDLELLVRVDESSKLVPDELAVEFRPALGRPDREMRRVDDYRHSYRIKNIVDPFELRVAGGDAVTPWYTVELVESPSITDIQIVATPPEYVGKTFTLPEGEGPHSVYPGTSLTISGKTSKPLSSATLWLPDESKLEFTAKGRSEFKFALPAADWNAGRYGITLTDEQQLTSPQRTHFTLGKKRDQIPRVDAKLIGITGLIVPSARLPISATIRDDFAVTDVELAYTFRGQLDGSDVSTSDTWQHESWLELAGAEEYDREVTSEVFWDLQPMDLPAGVTLTFRIRGKDNDDVSGPKWGETGEFLMRVVTPDELREDLLRREKEQRQELERLLKDQQALLVDVKALAADLNDKPEFDDEARAALLGLQRQQKVLGGNISEIARKLSLLVIEIDNNRLENEDGPLRKRLSELIVTPLEDLAIENIPAIEDLFSQTRRLAEEADQRGKSFGQLQSAQQELIDKLEQILTHLVKVEGFQEAVNLLYEIEKSQREVFQLTKKEEEERIRRLFNQGGDEN